VPAGGFKWKDRVPEKRRAAATRGEAEVLLSQKGKPEGKEGKKSQKEPGESYRIGDWGATTGQGKQGSWDCLRKGNSTSVKSWIKRRGLPTTVGKGVGLKKGRASSERDPGEGHFAQEVKLLRRKGGEGTAMHPKKRQGCLAGKSKNSDLEPGKGSGLLWKTKR